MPQACFDNLSLGNTVAKRDAAPLTTTAVSLSRYLMLPEWLQQIHVAGVNWLDVR